ncbi:unnamed protein product [Owenia fusiformis]|uniref:Uncharacterized protein n=1 Tax=Owenia fusiformis TaxID=6347 RepID=A0A8J1XWS2_OWEFU|nr:unnamed protein product [Owenia fusiformis]
MFASGLLNNLRTVCNLSRRFIHIGETAEITKTFTAEDVRLFSEISEDRNPVHLDTEYAKTSQFGRCIVHGVLSNGLISSVLGNKLPGFGTIFISQQIEFPNPLYVGEAVTAKVEVLEIRKRLVTFQTICFKPDDKKVVLQGTAKILLPKPPTNSTKPAS